MVIHVAGLILPSPLAFRITSRDPNFLPCSSPRRRLYCKRGRGEGPSWDSNAEDVRTGGFRFQEEGFGKEESSFGSQGKRNWWSAFEDDELDEDEEFEWFEEESIWDKIWIFKVLKEYGYFLPAIIASMLLATGPKAFLMALALPLGQSALSLAFDKVWGRERERPRPKSGARKRPFSRHSENFTRRKEEKGTEAKETRRDPESWVGTDRVKEDKDKPRAGSFGGWDELDREPLFRKRNQSPKTVAGFQSQRGKLTRRWRSKETPLFLRLLIAVFPFLGSWTRLL